MEGLCYGPLVVTPLDLGQGSVVRCPVCFRFLPLAGRDLGQVMTCPYPGCTGRLRVNPFVVPRPQLPGEAL
ncbi:MAG: hypothetical protein KKA73_09090 [Chloroflexi bacterium]|nr:hypothetical protein [Chloroflexota bacterium]MBU1747833.1 hypothetical protein [Chloroflexota bacterium]